MNEDQGTRKQYKPTAAWLSEVFADEQLRRGSGLKDENKDFFTCPEGQELTLSFRFLRMSKAATHAGFLLQPPIVKWLHSKGQLAMDPDADGYSGQGSLQRNRAFWFKAPKTSKTNQDDRLWELYSCSMATVINEPDRSDANTGLPIGR